MEKTKHEQEKQEEKMVIINNQTTIEKANHLALSSVDRSLSFNQMKLLSFAVLRLPLKGLISTFSISDFADFLNIQKYRKNQFEIDSQRVTEVKFTAFTDSFFDEGTDVGTFETAVLIPYIRYQDGVITIEFNKRFEMALKQLTKRYMTLDLSIMQKMKSGYSWILYEFLKQSYGSKYTKLKKVKLSVQEVYDIFKIDPETTPTYKTFGNVRTKVIELAIKEINEHTELCIKNPIYYKTGRSHYAVELEWVVHKTEYSANDEQIEFLEVLIKELSSRKNSISKTDDDQNAKVIEIIETLENLDFQGLTKTQASENIDKAKEIINVLNKAKTEQGKLPDTLDLSDEKTIEEISILVTEMFISEGMSRATSEYMGYKYTEKFLPTAKENMKHLDNINSIARYIVTCAENLPLS